VCRRTASRRYSPFRERLLNILKIFEIFSDIKIFHGVRIKKNECLIRYSKLISKLKDEKWQKRFVKAILNPENFGNPANRLVN
jgi:hypothetical protein